MVKIILWCSSYSPQANMLLDNMAPTYQAVTQKTTSQMQTLRFRQISSQNIKAIRNLHAAS